MDSYVMGRNTLEEILKHKPEILLEVFVNQTEQSNVRKDSLMKSLVEKKVKITFVSKNQLFALVDSDSHQSFVGRIKPRHFLDIDSFIEEENENRCVLMLDGIFDPHNMGAIIRIAECFKIDAVIFSRNRGCDITPVVTKSSSGGSELVPMMRVSNLADSLRKFKEGGYSIIVAENKEETEDIYSFIFPEKSLLILGSEGEGVQPLLRKMAQLFVRIPLLGKIDSLNVAQTAAIFLAFMRKPKS